MTRINLLPWREEIRKDNRDRFLAMLGGAAVAGVIIWFAGHAYYNHEIGFWESRNTQLQGEINALNREIARIRDLEATKESLIARMNVIQDLQQGRPQIVHLMHQLADTVPEGVHLTRIQQNSNSLTISGIAESNARVSTYMENLDSSDWLAEPSLDVIQVRSRDNRRVSEYTLRVKQTTPNDEEGAE
ncbi:pilus assembly protein PilN [Alkalilimnicola ehrlichii]|uniref:Pilus assembly protein PilN n=1 Tax=Alkalilimnicola ehrlichii TaxID=351052 RepID=A0A3E0X4F0_9GAMM|nr:PilN domain-containing protein [Alkalilimnicola ehrlichii]RFA31159.1 pilus assembly protein PilN [Alkalilimnicola ehrlichii]RFA39555.1 pilus assembly protein PilN [Alkalilimnicola ehrlichii]